MDQYELMITYRTYYKWLPKQSRSNIDEIDEGRADNATKNLKGVAHSTQPPDFPEGGNRIRTGE